MSWDPIAYLKSRYTRQLLGLRNRIYAVNGHGSSLPELNPNASYDVSDNHQGMNVTMSQVKAELATRPHVPNKKEARAIRQAKAKAKK